jgi:hypothetical protein
VFRIYKGEMPQGDKMGCDRSFSERCDSCDFGEEVEGGCIWCNKIGEYKMPFLLGCDSYILSEEFK